MRQQKQLKYKIYKIKKSFENNFVVKMTSVFKTFRSYYLWQVWMPTIIDFIVIQKTKLKNNQKMFYLTKVVLYSWLIIMTFRLNAVAVIFNFKKLSNLKKFYFIFDPLLEQFITSLNFFDPYMMIVASFSPLYGIFVDWAIYFLLDSQSLNFFHYYIYKNCQHFWKLNFAHFLQYSSGDRLKKVKKLIIFCKNIWTDKVGEGELTFAHPKLRHLPSSVLKGLRARAVLLTVASSINVVLSCVLFCKFYIIFYKF